MKDKNHAPDWIPLGDLNANSGAGVGTGQTQGQG